MPAPSTPIFDWATNANHADPGEPWDGQPAKVDPPAGRQTSGFFPEDNPTAEELNAILNNYSEWAQYHEGHWDPATREPLYGDGYILRDVTFQVGQWVITDGTVALAGTNWTSSPCVVLPGATAAELLFPLDRMLPKDADLTAIDVLGYNGVSSPATVSMRMRTHTVNWTTGAIASALSGGLASYAASGAFQLTYVVTPGTWIIDPTGDPATQHQLRVSKDAGGTDTTEVHAVRLRFRDYGPKNE